LPLSKQISSDLAEIGSRLLRWRVKRKFNPGERTRLQRNFWLVTIIVTVIVLGLTLLDAYYLGFH